jgi:hypothetical protein
MYTKLQITKIIADSITGKWVPAHDERGHHYRLSGTTILEDSVTTKNILDKPRLVPWAIGLAIDFLEKDNRFELLSTDKRKDIITAAKLQYKDVRDDAGDVGHVAHQAIEDYCVAWMNAGFRPKDVKEFIKDGTDLRAVAVARAAEKVFDKYKSVPVASEIVVGKAGSGAGTLDMLVLNENNEIELWDWKSSNNINDFYACQVSAYKAFFEHMTGLTIARCRIFKLDKWSDKFHCYLVTNTEKAYQAYLACSAIYDWMNDGEKKLLEDKVRITI